MQGDGHTHEAKNNIEYVYRCEGRHCHCCLWEAGQVGDGVGLGHRITAQAKAGGRTCGLGAGNGRWEGTALTLTLRAGRATR